MNAEQARALLRALCFARVIARGETPIHVRTPDGVIRAALPHPPLPRGKVRLDCGHERSELLLSLARSTYRPSALASSTGDAQTPSGR